MAWYNFGTKKKSIEIKDPQIVRVVFNGELGGYKPLVYFKENTEQYLEKGFDGNHVVFTIADWCGRKMATVQPLIYKIKNKKALKQYQNFQKGFAVNNVIKTSQLRKKAFEMDEVDVHPLIDILERPNPTQTWDEFIYGYYIYKKFAGICYIKGVKVENSTRTKGYQELYLLPAQYIEVVSGAGGLVVDHYKDTRVPRDKILPEDVCVIKSFSYKDGSLNGNSIFKSASKLLQKSSDAMDAETETLQNRGAKKIVFPNLSPTELSTISLPDSSQDSNMGESIIKKIREAGHNGVAINSVPLGALDLGLSPTDLGILESKVIDNKAWCSLFHVSSMVVLNEHESASYDTMKQNMILSITDGIIPELEALKTGLNKWLIPSYEEELYLDFDYTEFPELYSELFKVAMDLKNTEAVTINEIRGVIKYDAYEGENGDKILVSGNKKILDDITFDLPQVDMGNTSL